MKKELDDNVIEKEKQRLDNMMEYENNLYSQGYNIIAGIDEAGRGPLAGPVVACAVILKKDERVEGVNDSKKLSPKKRDKLFDEIIDKCVAYGIGIIDNKVIDEINILEATRLAMKQAIENLKVQPDYLLIDAETHIATNIPLKGIIKGDSLSQSIAAASIIAKVTRDRMLLEFDKKYPEYVFSKHKGYGTALHIAKIKEYGLTDIHRKTFCKNFINN